MGVLGRTWRAISISFTVYTIYKKLQEMNTSRYDFYSDLTPDLQAQWDDLFGKPVKPTTQESNLKAGV